MAALRKTLMDSPSVAYFDSASGVYLSQTLFPSMKHGTQRLGLEVNKAILQAL